MKLFGIPLWPSRSTVDRITIRSIRPSGTAISKIPKLPVKILSYAMEEVQGRGHFLEAEYDLAEVGRIEDTDSFVRQSFKKKEGLMFKEGFSFRSPDKNTVQYIKRRMAQIEAATDITTLDLMKRVARSLIRTSNAFLVKSRIAKASGGKIRTDPNGKELEPVAGYWPAAPETMRPNIDPKTGKILAWRQLMPGGMYKDFALDDVIHFHIDRKEGFVFGTPTLVPVKDDIRALRQIEENIEMLLYQHLFPLFHYQVGTETAPAGYNEEGQKEIDAVEQQIRLMPSEGAIITPERHKIEAVGAQGRALHAEGYLTHFKKRVFAGLGVSQVDMGDGDTTNRATAQTLSRALIDTVKDIQDSLEAQFDHYVVKELLLESTFGEDVLEDDMMVHLVFHEIDIQNKMEQEKHLSELFEANGITLDEFRVGINREPIPIPDDPEDQDMSKYREWRLTHWKLFEEPRSMIVAGDESYSAFLQGLSQAPSSAITTQALKTQAQAKAQEEKRAAEEDRQTKVAITRAKPRATSKQDNFLASDFKTLEADTESRILQSIAQRGVLDHDYVSSLARVWAGYTADKLHAVVMQSLITGFNDQTAGKAAEAELLINTGRNETRARVEHYMHKLVENTVSLLFRRVDEKVGGVKLSEATSDVIRELRVAFDATRYRTAFIWDVETRKAYNYGRVLGMRHLGIAGFSYSAASATSCDRCKALDGQLMIAAAASMEDVPPLHAYSRMTLEIVPAIQDTAQESQEDLEDGSLESCVLKVKNRLRKENPDMSEKTIKSKAFAICNASLKKSK
jgi:hypothetical protein